MVRAREPFVRSMDRVAGVLALHRALHGGPGRPRQHVSDMLRGSLVLAVGALDGLILESVFETVEPALLKGESGPHVIKWVERDPARLLTALATNNAPQEVVRMCREQMSTMTFQKSKMIEGVLTGVAQCEMPWAGAAQRLASRRSAWTPARVTTRLDDFVLRRHAIAHSGDVAEGRRTTTPITLKYVTEAERVIRAVGLSVCDRVDDRIRALRRA